MIPLEKLQIRLKFHIKFKNNPTKKNIYALYFFRFFKVLFKLLTVIPR